MEGAGTPYKDQLAVPAPIASDLSLNEKSPLIVSLKAGFTSIEKSYFKIPDSELFPPWLARFNSP